MGEEEVAYLGGRRGVQGDHHRRGDFGRLDLGRGGLGVLVLRDVVDRIIHVVIVRAEKIHDEVLIVVRFAIEETIDLVQAVVQQV